jgi:hypothetical protein
VLLRVTAGINKEADDIWRLWWRADDDPLDGVPMGFNIFVSNKCVD